jgi:hypothetical protein
VPVTLPFRCANYRCLVQQVKAVRHRSARFPAVLACITAMAVTGCAAAAPAERYDGAALRAGLRPDAVEGIGFTHRTYHAPLRAGRHLHVYLEGDGTPFVERRRVARDPTPRRPMALELLRLDPGPAVLLGRPCYHGLTDGCGPQLWTTARYSEAVVASTARAIERLLARGGYATATLIGFSGGGAIAVLVAERLEAVSGVVTIAANLDIAAWTAHHGYTPLHGSLNPVDVIGTRPELRHLHLSGSADDNVPGNLHDAVRARLPAGAVRTVDGFDHGCCWPSVWPDALSDL